MKRLPLEVRLALGRIFRLMSRPEQPGDAQQYEACRALILDASEHIDTSDRAPDYVRDRMRGAQGD
jgi:hypothetical protein